MISYIKQLIKGFFLTKDPLFSRRPVSDVKFGAWLLVEISANDYTILLDMLNTIRLSDSDDETKGRQIIGLRYCALAMSLRTKSGRIPLNYNEQKDLLWLGSLPFSQIDIALRAIAELSDIPWLTPDIEQTANTESNETTQPVIDKEALKANPS
ncbi:hypothetical protein [Glaciecola sp. KUL10]|uniref:hypothetical protein n=1 Tax=Glaciecola sp. (strain KUL10) TaxID=2161813 RepID=UPI000D78C558|nr:hypothetical protein [Glaciecola sp. KUL10]GBL02931.1 hypothetical protein KUL10_02040 [Glaciecola sp. KUL10]